MLLIFALIMEIKSNVSLKPYNTFGLDVVAERFCAFKSSDELVEAMGSSAQTPSLVLGGGSNILLTKNVSGLVPPQ